MGWLFSSRWTRRDLIAERSRDWEHQRDDGLLVVSKCLAQCYRGGVFSGVLWSVWERTVVKVGQPTEPEQRWISCDLLRYEGGEWGYKDMEESMHPYYYSCPLGYIDLVPIEKYGGHAEWRELVRSYHARIAEKRRAKKASRQLRSCGSQTPA